MSNATFAGSKPESPMRDRKGISARLHQKLLASVVDLLIRSGESDTSIKAAFEKALNASRRAHLSALRCQEGVYSLYGDISADLLRLWHRDSRFVDELDAKPVALHATRGKASIRAMIKLLNAEVSAAEVLTFLKDARLVRRTRQGKYLPATKDAGTITRDDPFVAEHLARSVIRLFSTVQRNTAPKDTQPLIERYAYVSDLSPDDCSEFAKFSKSQGLAYLQAVDDWMEQRRAGRKFVQSRRKNRGVVAGVQVVAYLGDRAQEGAPARGRRTKGIEGTDGSPSAPKPLRSTSLPSTPA